MHAKSTKIKYCRGVPVIESVSKRNLSEVLPLLRAYQEFYEVAEVSDSENEKFFSQFSDTSVFGCQFLFRESGKAVAFATVYFTFTSTIASKVAVLNDLYVCPEYRGKKIGRQLLDHCHSYAVTNGAARLQWVTAPDNKPAQRLYDSMNTAKSKWYLYTYSG